MKRRIQSSESYYDPYDDCSSAYEEYLSDVEDRAKEKYYEEKYGL